MLIDLKELDPILIRVWAPGFVKAICLCSSEKNCMFFVRFKSIPKVPLAKFRKLAKGTFSDEVASVCFGGALANSDT